MGKNKCKNECIDEEDRNDDREDLIEIAAINGARCPLRERREDYATENLKG